MAENIVIYAGTGKVGESKKRAIERAAKQARKDGSVSSYIFEMLKKYGSAQLKNDLEAADNGRK